MLSLFAAVWLCFGCLLVPVAGVLAVLWLQEVAVQLWGGFGAVLEARIGLYGVQFWFCRCGPWVMTHGYACDPSIVYSRIIIFWAVSFAFWWFL